MEKISSLILVSVAVVSAAACGSKSEPKKPALEPWETDAPRAQSSPDKTTKPAASKPAKPVSEAEKARTVLAAASDEMCRCSNRECAHAVRGQLHHWYFETRPQEPSSQIRVEIEPIKKRYMECSTGAVFADGLSIRRSNTYRRRTSSAWIPFSLNTGVPACDSYIEDYMDCIHERAAEAEKVPMTDDLVRSALPWEKLAATSPEMIAEICLKSRERTRAATQRLDCTSL